MEMQVEDMRRAAHVKIAGLREDQRMKLFGLARAVKEAKNDRAKRKKALADLDQALRYYKACGVLTAREQENIWYLLNRGL